MYNLFEIKINDVNTFIYLAKHVKTRTYIKLTCKIFKKEKIKKVSIFVVELLAGCELKAQSRSVTCVKEICHLPGGK